MDEIQLTEKEIEVAKAMNVSLEAVKMVKRRMARTKPQAVALSAGVDGYGDLLEGQDRAFCKLYQLSEPGFIALVGGLASYLKLRLSREALRKAGKQVPVLPAQLSETDVNIMKALNVSTLSRARIDLEQHLAAVAGAAQFCERGGN